MEQFTKKNMFFAKIGAQTSKNLLETKDWAESEEIK